MKKTCFISLLGFSNSGKSTFVNSLIKKKISILKFKNNTTKEMSSYLLLQGAMKLILIDTPGIINNKFKIKIQKNIIMQKSLKYLYISDINIIILDLIKILRSIKILDYHDFLLKKKPIIILNKIDLVCNSYLLFILKIIRNKKFNKVFFISALYNMGINRIRKYLFNISYIKFFNYYYNESSNIIINKSVRFIINNIIKEKFSVFLKNKFYKYSLINTDLWIEKANIIYIYNSILVNKKVRGERIFKNENDIMNFISFKTKKIIEYILKKKVYLCLFIRNIARI